MKRALIALLLASVTMMFAVVANAGQEQNDAASISLHIGPWVSKSQCDSAPNPLPSAAMVTEVNGCAADYYMIYILVCNASDSLGVAGLEYGIIYDELAASGVDVNGWYPCSDLEFSSDVPPWPASGSGNLQTWDYNTSCQNTLSEPYVPRTVVAIAGVLDVVVYSPDNFIITPRPASGRAKIGDCFGAEYDITTAIPSQLGVGAFCLPGTGYNPCGAPTATESSTWGKIKQQY